MNTIYFDSIIDDFGIWQHSDGLTPHLHHGYSLDDAARGLVTCLALGKPDQANVLFNYLKQSRIDTEFHGFAHDNREFFAGPASDDAKAQVVWAYGYAVHQGFRVDEAQAEMASFRASIARMSTLRGPAYALLGAVYLDPIWAAELAATVAGRFSGLADSWFWPETPMTYALGILPYCLLRYELVCGDSQYHGLALRVLEFIEYVSTHNRPLGPVGNDGWHAQGQATAPNYSQQPIDAAYMVWAHTAAYQTTQDKHHLQKAQRWMAWFDGDNIAKKSLINPANNQCLDGIDPTGVSTESGAESNLCYLLSRWTIAHRATV